MISEQNILIWFGQAQTIIVLIVMLRQYVLKHITDYDNVVRGIDAEDINVRLINARNTQSVKVSNTPTAIPGKEQTDLFREVFESAPECMILQKRDGIIELINNTGLKLLETKESSHIIDDDFLSTVK